MTAEKTEILNQLRKQMLALQGFKPVALGNAQSFGLGSLENCFPNAVFPIGTIHEFLAHNPEQAAASGGFITGILAKLMEKGNACLWISRNRKLFPPAMQNFGVSAQQVIFIDHYKEKEILWLAEEALKCEGLAAVICELPDLDFAQSRRLQLVVEKSKVTGIILRKEPKHLSATACTVRWQITPQPSKLADGLPGVGHPRWEVQLLKVRNGSTGTFLIEWAQNHFQEYVEPIEQTTHTKQAG